MQSIYYSFCNLTHIYCIDSPTVRGPLGKATMKKDQTKMSEQVFFVFFMCVC